MRPILGLLLAAAVAVPAVRGYVDEEHQAVIVEGDSPDEASRSARQLLVAQYAMSGLGLSPLLTPPLNQPCLNKERRLGRCLSLKECYPYFKIFNLGWRDTWVMGHYDTCSYRSPQGDQVFGVCCDQSAPELPPVEEEDNKVVDDKLDAVVEEFPIEFALEENCGFRTPQPKVTLYNGTVDPSFYIVHGNEAVPHEFPFMVALMNVGGDRVRQFCGGSLIDSTHILTAAHCVSHLSKRDVQHLRVRLGDHNINSDDSASIEKRVKRVIRHVGFSSKTLHNDVAILTMESPVTYNNYIQPICLAAGSNQYVNQIVTVAGWGTLTEGGRQPNELMKVDVEVWSNDRCRSSYGSSSPGGITSHMICASLPDRDSCSGDSGGPLFKCHDGSRGTCTQVGIVSWGIGCAQPQYPGVYTRITAMRDWIKRIVQDY